MAWFDAGVNLLDSRFDANAVVASAIAAGVSKLCVITTHPDEWAAAQQLYAQFPDNLVYTLGVHPHNAKVVNHGTFTDFEELLQCPGLVAVGECGLDFNRNFSPPGKQIEVFETQLALAKSFSKPLYLHEREAFEQQLSCIERVFGCGHIDGIAHCFTGNKTQLQAYVKKGLYIGITGWLCDDKRGADLREAVQSLPLNRLILETDAPYLFPKTLRPKKRNNLPEFIPHIGEDLANLIGQPLNAVEKLSYTNATTLFGIAKD